MNQLADGIVDRHDTLGVQLAERYVECPMSGRKRAEAVKGEIGALADPDAGMTNIVSRVPLKNRRLSDCQISKIQ
jgi:hypothetical protein